MDVKGAIKWLTTYQKRQRSAEKGKRCCGSSDSKNGRLRFTFLAETLGNCLGVGDRVFLKRFEGGWPPIWGFRGTGGLPYRAYQPPRHVLIVARKFRREDSPGPTRGSFHFMSISLQALSGPRSESNKLSPYEMGDRRGDRWDMGGAFSACHSCCTGGRIGK